MRTIHVVPAVRLTSLRRLTAALLTTTALVGVVVSGAALTVFASAPARAAGAGGAGGAGDVATVTAGNGGSGGTNGSGADGTAGSGASTGGAGGSSSGASGSDGSADPAGGGGGGGGASGADVTIGVLNNTGTITGNAGGNGGNGGSVGGGGGGGGGGGDIIVTGTGVMSNSGSITGGASGAGGFGALSAVSPFIDPGGDIGSGGNAGTGLIFTMGGVVFTNTASGSVTGGAGDSLSGGLGGAGIVANATITIVNAGSIAGGTGSPNNGDGIDVAGALTLTNSGTITGLNGVSVTGGALTLTNSGAITSVAYGGSGVYSTGVVDITNAGSISGNLGSYGINVGGGKVTNLASSSPMTGLIEGNQYAIYSSGAIDISNAGTIQGDGTSIYAGGTLNITNSGTIASSFDGVTTTAGGTIINAATGVIRGSDDAISSGPGSLTVTNSGAILATSGFAITGGSPTSSLIVTNNAGDGVSTGVISGGDAAIYYQGSTTVTNSGAIIGTSDYGISSGGVLTVTNNAGDGQTTGVISGGSYAIYYFGNDTLTITNAGTISGGTGAILGAGTASISNTGTITGATGITTYGGTSVFNDGTITGTGGTAIYFGVSGNTLTLGTNSVITGNVIAAGSDTLQLGGTGSATFDVGLIGGAAQYQGFSIFNKVGSSTWTLDGTPGQTTGWNVLGGTLTTSQNDGTGAVAGTGAITAFGTGGITLGGGTLRTGVSGWLANDITFAAGTTSTLAAATGTTLSLGGDSGTPGDTSTSTTGNLASNLYLGANAVAQFGSATDTGTIQIGMTSVNNMLNVDPTARIVVAGGTLQDLQNGLWQITSAAASTTVNAGATLDFNGATFQFVNNLLGAGTVNTGATAGPALNLLVDNGATDTFSGRITGAGSVNLVSAGTGIMVLSGSNDYTGGTAIRNGMTLQLGDGGTTGAITGDVINGGTLSFDRSNAYTFAGVISDYTSSAGQVVQFGTGITTLTGTNTYSGGTTLAGGTLSVGAEANLGDLAGGLTFNGGMLQVTGTNFTSTARAITWGASGGGFDIADAANTFTVSQLLSGTGGLTKAGTGTLVLSVNDTYSGATSVTAGTLRQGIAGAFSSASAYTIAGGATLDLASFTSTIGSLAGAGNVALGGGTLNAGGDNTSTLFSGVIAGSGSFVKTGTGRLNLTGISSYSGATTIDGGTLSVNGAIASSAVTVNSGGTLGGNGTVGNTLINGGTLSPGNSIGLLTVAGNLALTSASSYMVEVSTVTADRVTVTGTANLGGAGVNASFAAGNYISKQYTIVSAAGGLGGSSFGALTTTNLPANFATALSYDANDAYLNLKLNFGIPSQLNANQANVGNALTGYFNRTGGIGMDFAALSASGLTQASGETATGTQQATFDAMTLFMGVMTDPFTAGRDFAVPGAMGYAATDPRNANALFAKAMSPAPAFEARWNVWGTGFGGSQTTSGNASTGSNNANSSIGGFAVGADYLMSPNTVAGFALSGGATNFSVANGGSGHSDLFQAGAFVRHSVASAYITGALAYGWQDVTTNRTVTLTGIDHLHAEYHANAYSARIEGGNRYLGSWLGGVGLTPYVAAQVTAFDLPAYAENVAGGVNTFALNYASKTATATRSELGFRSDKSFAVSDAILTLRGRAAWAHDYDTDRSVAATFQTLPGASFTVNGAAPAHDTALTTASAEITFISGISLAATFEGAFSDVTTSYAGKGTVRYAW